MIIYKPLQCNLCSVVPKVSPEWRFHCILFPMCLHSIRQFILFPVFVRQCQCSPEGTDPSNTQCNEKGECSCKQNVIGTKCTLCKTGFYGLESSNPYGCRQCFCYGHSGVCKAADGYTGRNISNQFTSGLEGWTVINEQGTYASIRFSWPASSPLGFCTQFICMRE